MYSEQSFLFSLYNKNGYQPMQLKLELDGYSEAIYGQQMYGPSFGGGKDLMLNDFNGYTIPGSYQIPPGCSKASYCSFFAGSGSFKHDHIEVFYLLKTWIG